MSDKLALTAPPPGRGRVGNRRRGGGLTRGEHPADELLQEKIRRRLSSFARNTQLALGADWRIWYGFVQAERAAGCPRALWPIAPVDLTAFIYALSPPLIHRPDGTVQVDVSATGLQIRRAGTVRRYLASLRTLTRLAGRGVRAFSHPEVQHALRTISRGRRATRPKTGPVRMEHVRRLLEDQGAGKLQELRDRAIVALGYCALLRPVETAQVRVEHLLPDDTGGAALYVPVSKADPEGLGQHCQVVSPVLQLIRLWMRRAAITSGPLFRAIDRHGRLAERPLSRGAVSLIFKRMAPLMMLESQHVSGHSGRIGAVHDMQDARLATSAIALAGRWATEHMVGVYGRGRAAREGAMAQLWANQLSSVSSEEGKHTRTFAMRAAVKSRGSARGRS